jgi:hypothetical protein
MKHLKMLGLAAIAAAALTAFAGAGTASANSTELYTGHATQGAGLTLHMTLKAGTSLVVNDTSGELNKTCKQSTVAAKTGQVTVVNGEISAAIESWTLGECTFPTATLTNGSLDITSVGDINGDGLGDGTVTGTGTDWTTLVFGLFDCIYGTGAGTHLGTLLGSTSGNASLSINAVINETAPHRFGCPETTKLVANFTVTSPVGLNVRT